MPVYDTKTGQEIFYEDQRLLEDAVESGQVSFRKGQNITVFNPEDEDDVLEIPASEYQQARTQGYRIESDLQKDVREYVQENDGFIGQTKVFTGELANTLAFSVPEIIYRNTADPYEWAKVQALRDEHEMSSIAGTGIGLGLNVYGLARTGALKATEAVSKKAVDITAKRLSSAVKGLTKKQADDAARGILSRSAKTFREGAGVVTRNTAQGALEGTIDMSIPAAAELAFGNYEEAAESLLIGSVFGGVLGGGTRTLFDGAGKIAPKLRKVTDKGLDAVLGPNEEGFNFAQRSMHKTLSTLTNIPEDVIVEGLRNPAKTRNAANFSDLFDKIQPIVQQQDELLEVAKREATESEDVLKVVFKNDQQRMKEIARAPNKPVADLLSETVESMKMRLGELSERAEDILARDIPNPIIPKMEILRKIDDSIEELGGLKVSETSKRQLSGLKAVRDRVDENFPDAINGSQAREFFKDLRQDLDWNAPITEFGSGYTRAIKNLTESTSDEIKRLSPDYADTMAEMKVLAEAIQESAPVVNNEVTRRSVAARLVKEGQTASDTVTAEKVSRLIQAAETQSDFVGVSQRLNELITDARAATDFNKLSRKAQIEAPLGELEKFYEKHYPDLYENLKLKRQQLTDRQALYNELKPAISGSLEGKMRKVVRDKNTIETKRAFDRLSELSGGEDLYDQIKFSLIKEGLNSARTQGSRATNLFAFLGAGLTTPFDGGLSAAILAGGAGALGGAAIDRYGGRAFAKLLESNETSSRIRALLVSENQMSVVARKMDLIGDKLRTSFARGPKRASAAREFGLIQNRIIEKMIQKDRADKRSREDKKKARSRGGRSLNLEAYESIKDRLIDIESSKDYQDAVGIFIGDIASGGGPNIAGTFQQKLVDGIKYLKNEMPKDPLRQTVFAEKTKFEPSDYELQNFMDKAAAISDPMIIFDALEAGKLTRSHVEAVEVVYPNLARHFKDRIVNELQTLKEPEDYLNKVMLSYILGDAVDDSLSTDNFRYFQDSFQDQQTGLSESDMARDRSSYRPRIKFSGARDHQTLTQRLEAN